MRVRVLCMLFILFLPNHLLADLISVDDFVSQVCPNQEVVYYEGRGKFLGQIQNQPFDPAFTLGYKTYLIGRCVQDSQGHWTFLLRRLGYYYNLKTSELLDTWKNPITDEQVAVIHTALKLGHIDLPPFLEVRSSEKPNAKVLVVPMEQQLTFHAPEGEQYKPFFRANPSTLFQSINFISNPIVSGGTLIIHEVGPFRPWMKLGQVEGQMILTASISQVESFEHISEFFRKEIETRLPLYKTIPRCKSSHPENTSSLANFPSYYEAYLRKQRFPLPAPERNEACQELPSRVSSERL